MLNDEHMHWSSNVRCVFSALNKNSGELSVDEYRANAPNGLLNRPLLMGLIYVRPSHLCSPM